MLTTTIYDKNYQRIGFVNDAEALYVTPKHNDVGMAKLTLPLDHPKAALILGAALDGGNVRAVFEQDGEHRLSGPIGGIEASGPQADGTITFTFDDDFGELRNILGWPVPAAGLDAQTVEYYTITGPAETVVKDLVRRNGVQRLGKAITIAPDLGRGAVITVSIRFHPLYDKLIPVIDAAGIGVSIKQSGAGLLLDCYEPEPYPLELSEGSGIITGWSWSYLPASATDVIVGGQGDGVARVLRPFSDSSRAASLNNRIEVFRDARDSDSDTVYQERADETFAETAAKPGVRITLSETSNFRFGAGGINLGAKVRLRIGPGLVVDDILREATISDTAENGHLTVPSIGENKSVEQVIAGGLKSLARGLRDLRSR